MIVIFYELSIIAIYLTMQFYFQLPKILEFVMFLVYALL